MPILTDPVCLFWPHYPDGAHIRMELELILALAKILLLTSAKLDTDIDAVSLHDNGSSSRTEEDYSATTEEEFK